MRKRNPHHCPHCGNSDPKFIDDNGLSSRHPDYTMLCTKPCAPEDNSFGGFAPDLGTCGMQWEPNALNEVNA